MKLRGNCFYVAPLGIENSSEVEHFFCLGNVVFKARYCSI